MKFRIYKWRIENTIQVKPSEWKFYVIDSGQLHIKNTIVINDHLKLYKKNFICTIKQLMDILEYSKNIPEGSAKYYEIHN